MIVEFALQNGRKLKGRRAVEVPAPVGLPPLGTPLQYVSRQGEWSERAYQDHLAWKLDGYLEVSLGQAHRLDIVTKLDQIIEVKPFISARVGVDQLVRYRAELGDVTAYLAGPIGDNMCRHSLLATCEDLRDSDIRLLGFHPGLATWGVISDERTAARAATRRCADNNPACWHTDAGRAAFAAQRAQWDAESQVREAQRAEREKATAEMTARRNSLAAARTAWWIANPGHPRTTDRYGDTVPVFATDIAARLSTFPVTWSTP